MDHAKIQNFITEFKNELRNKIARTIAFSSMVFFFFYVIIKLAVAIQIIDIRSNSEFSYLQKVGIRLVRQQKMQKSIIFNFLDSTNKLISPNTFKQQNSSDCNNLYYYCNLSNSQNFSNINSVYRLMKANSRILSANKNIVSIIVASSNHTIFLNLSYLGLTQNEVNYSTINNLIQKNSNNIFNEDKESYILSQSPINTTAFYLMACQIIYIFSIKHHLCVVSINNVLGNVSSFHSNYYYTYNNLDIVQTGIQLKSITDWVHYKTESLISSDVLQNCLDTSINLLSGYSDPTQGKVFQCKPDPSFYFDMFGPYFPFIFLELRINMTVAPMVYENSFFSQQKSFYYYISSNSTYHYQINRIVRTTSSQIRFTAYTLILFVAITLLFITYPNQLVENTIIESILVIHNLYEHLRNKEQKQFINLFKNHKIHSFSHISDYLNKYLWVYKLIKCNKSKQKYKKLLKEGIELFGDDDLPVKKYIYEQLITLQKRMISKYFKVRQLPVKKKTTSKLQFHLPEPKLVNHLQKQKAAGKRRYANFQLLNPDDDELMKNISVSFKGNRGVRFSNDIQTIEIDQGPVLRRSKLSEISPQSCETIKNDLSQNEVQSVKRSDHNKDSNKSLKDQDQSYTSLNEMTRSNKKKDSGLRSRTFESVHGDLQNMRLDEKQSEEEELIEQENQQTQLYQLSRQTLTEEIANTFHRTSQFYQELLRLKLKELKSQREDELVNYINLIYQLTVEKYELLARMFSFQNEMRLPQDEEQRDEVSQFRDLIKLEKEHMTLIKHQNIQKGEIVRLHIHQVLQLPVSFKNLQFLARSGKKTVRIVARRLLAYMAQNMAPHLDQVLMRNIQLSLEDELTNCTQKRVLLTLLTRTLQRYFSQFTQQIAQLRLVRQFYNKNNKKIYFIASIINPKPFANLINKFYQFIQPFDMLNVYNLDEQNYQTSDLQASEPFLTKARVKRSATDRVKFQLNEDDFADLFNFSIERNKDHPDKGTSNSAKTISKKRIYQKDFHQILNSIEADETQFSKYLVVLLGEEHNSYSGETEESSSSANHRPEQQKIHQEITKIFDKGYYHIILAGHQLSLYPSKYGRLKKYLKLSPEILEIDLNDKDQEQNHRMLQKYLN